MRVLQINSVCGYGSTGKIAVDLYQTIQENGDNGIIAYGRGTAQRDIPTIRIGTEFAVRVHGVLSRITDKHGFYSKRATKKLIVKIKEYNPDIIHLHNIHGYYIHIGALFQFLKEFKKPVVWTLHDCWAFTGHCSHFDFIACNKWKTGCYDCPQTRKYPASYFADNSKWNYLQKKELFTSLEKLTLVTPSRWLAGVVEKSFLNQYPVHVIPNGIDLDVFQPRNGNARKKYGLGDKKILLGVANDWTERKGIDYFYQLANLLDSSYQIVLVGLSKKQLKSLPQKIVGIQRTSNVEELAELYTLADVFVNPTLEETLGLVNIEAQACGTPVVTFDSGGSAECIGENSGVVTSDKSVQSLYESILCYKNSSISTEYCRRHAQLFLKERSYAQYVSLYYNIINDN